MFRVGGGSVGTGSTVISQGAAWRIVSEENYRLRDLLNMVSPGWDDPPP